MSRAQSCHAPPRAAAGRGPQLKARWHELLVYAASHPLELALAELARRLGPVVYVPRIGYLVNDALLARAILHEDAVFTKVGPGSLGPVVTQLMGDNALLNMDGPSHRALRARLADLFSVAYLDRIAADVLTAPLGRLRDDLARGRTIDLVRFMHVLTGTMTCYLLGLDLPADRAEQTAEDIFRLGERLVAFVGMSTTGLTPEQLRKQRVHFDRLVEHARRSYEHGSRPDSIIERLRALGLGFDEVKGIVAVLFLVGMVTVSTAVPRMLALLVDTGQLARLRARPALLPSAIDEGLRCVVPVPAMARSIGEGTIVEGHRFGGGRRLLLLNYNICKDGRCAPQPWRFDIERPADPRLKHLWFGAGPHFCLGFALAQLEMRAVLGTLLDLPPARLRIVRRRYARGVLIPAYSALHVRLDRAAS
jgi:cytochrome P450